MIITDFILKFTTIGFQQRHDFRRLNLDDPLLPPFSINEQRHAPVTQGHRLPGQLTQFGHPHASAEQQLQYY